MVVKEGPGRGVVDRSPAVWPRRPLSPAHRKVSPQTVHPLVATNMMTEVAPFGCHLSHHVVPLSRGILRDVRCVPLLLR